MYSNVYDLFMILRRVRKIIPGEILHSSHKIIPILYIGEILRKVRNITPNNIGVILHILCKISPIQ